jgi:hypothetical protein
MHDQHLHYITKLGKKKTAMMHTLLCLAKVHNQDFLLKTNWAIKIGVFSLKK